MTANGKKKTPPGGTMRWTHELRDDPKVTGSTLVVGVILGTFMDYDGECYPSVPRLAVSCGLGVRAVQRALRKLERLGYLKVVFGVGRKTNLYKATFPRGVSSDTTADREVSPATPLRCLQSAREVSPGTPEVKDLKTSIEVKPGVMGDRAWQDLLDPDLLETARRLAAGAAVARSAESGWVARAGVSGR